MIKTMKAWPALLCLLPAISLAASSGIEAFRQLEEILPTPNVYRNASGAPGPDYWQQRADYIIDVELDEETQSIKGSELIRYWNHSPDSLNYLWLQLDNNIFSDNSEAYLSATSPDFDEFSYKAFDRLLAMEQFDGRLDILNVAGADGKPLEYTIVKTMMRIDLASPLRPGENIRLGIDWRYKINDAKVVRSRAGYEYFPEDKNHIFEIAHWYPRMVAYTDVTGWQNKQFIGSGEFTLELGDFTVSINVPADHLVSATGTLSNPQEVLSDTQRKRLKGAETAAKPVFIVSPEEAYENQSQRSSGRKTWVFEAENVRDFAFASSRKFIWDAQGFPMRDQTVMAMSFYPNEAEPLWSQYSTQAIIHTLDVYSDYTFQYPYPVAQSINGPVGGMEYPMICFNGPRPEEDGTYFAESGDKKPWRHSKYALISVIIHEVGHNYFPMIVNSDERQWTWMDEGVNTFLQFVAEQTWEENYPSKRGEPRDITEYMLSENQVPIMSNSESLLQFGNNAYAKPATALNILRETVLGRELFDFAFRQYAQRWKFKRPMPSDLFRTLEDASGIDLDWFWRGWFYSTKHVDIALTAIHEMQMDTRDPVVDKPNLRGDEEALPDTISEQKFALEDKRIDSHPELKDFYNDYDEYAVTPQDLKAFKELLEGLEDEEPGLLKVKRHFYVLDLKNVGGLVMPVILQLEYEGGESEIMRIPAEIWRRDADKISKLIMTEKVLKRVVVDPFQETADTDVENNYWPRRFIKSRFQLFKDEKEDNAMKAAQKAAAGLEQKGD